MNTLFEAKDKSAILERLGKLTPASPRAWGKMTAPQMLAHLSAGLETGTGDRPMKQKLIGKLLAPFIRSSIFGPKPFGRNGPTDPSFVITGDRDFEMEKKRLLALLEKFCGAGAAGAARYEHVFFGKMTGAEWGELQYKHLDHHLTQFGV